MQLNPPKHLFLSYEVAEMKNPKLNSKLGELRAIVVADWLYRWRFSSQEVLISLLTNGEKSRERTARDALNRWEKRGLIRSFALLTPISKKGFVLRKDGIFMLSLAMPNTEFSKAFTDTSKLTTSSNIVHDLCSQKALVSQFHKGKRLNYASEWELRNGKSGKIFDLIIENELGKRFGFEVEITPKPLSRLQDAFGKIENALDKQIVQQVIYFCATNGIQKSVQKQINKSGLQHQVQTQVPDFLKQMWR
ncbi:hypothetical protein J3998_12375 [Thiomicrorhabdus sp. 6S2-11]|uniref:Replication-relaxation n=1 Tax=Thiomicrorhabdus marina TaxID=2818442 RepID=A0ABS3Q7N9_9GAMM|nr:hypothetical protein [Thiomicrorhabdus marina]MBO1928369.1 hypothetical protein [Thiomicrorhabdus marina]